MNRIHALAPVAALLIAGQSYAHAPIFACDREGTTIRCEADGTYEFTAPSGNFHVAFDGGQYHNVTVYSTDID